ALGDAGSFGDGLHRKGGKAAFGNHLERGSAGALLGPGDTSVHRALLNETVAFRFELWDDRVLFKVPNHRSQQSCEGDKRMPGAVRYIVSDLEAAFEFYVNSLGFTAEKHN